MSDDAQIEDLKKYIAQAEESLEAAKAALFKLTGEEIGGASTPSVVTPPNLKVSDDGKIIEGIFNGENMVGPEGKIFPVPANYASKSKLLEGDKLKLTVAEDGSFIFKQIAPVDRKKLTGTLTFEDNMYHVTAEGKRYNLLYASVTYHKAKPGDKVTIDVPVDGNSTWAAFENIIHDVAPAAAEPAPEDIFNLNPGSQSPATEQTNPFSAAPDVPLPPTVTPASSADPVVNSTSANIGNPTTMLTEDKQSDPENVNSFGESVKTGDEATDLEI